MSTTKKSSKRMTSGILWLVVLAGVVILIARNAGVVSNVIVVLLGFGAVVLVHEFGHFIVAKLSGIAVEGFSIGMPPTLLGIRRMVGGIRFRILPMFFSKDDETSDEEGGMAFTLGKGDKGSETEYRIGLIPFGGYVKLLGQEDVGPVKQNDDPRSFANKPTHVRIAVIAAGVTMNVICAALVLMTVFLVGIDLQPPVVGGVMPGSSAAKAGLRPGDEFVAIAGDSQDLDFPRISIAAVFSGVDEAVPMTVRHLDGSLEDLTLVAEQFPGAKMRQFGIMPAQSLVLADITEPNVLEERTGLRPGDRVTAVNGQAVDTYWGFEDALRTIFSPTVTLTAERPRADGGVDQVETERPLFWYPSQGDPESEADLSHVYSMVPRLRVVPSGPAEPDPEPGANTERVLSGDIILAIGEIEYPTWIELRKATVESEGKPLAIKVLRDDANGVAQAVTVTVTPKRPPGSDRVVIGILVALDAEHPVVAKTVTAAGGPAALEVPRGARIVSVNGKAVSDFRDIITEVRRWEGQSVVLEYQLDGQAKGGVTLQTAQLQRPISVQPTPGEVLPFRLLERQYRAKGPLEAVAMGYRRTVMFIAMSCVTLKQLVVGLLSPKMLMGPVGIIAMSYQVVAQQSLVYYAYWLGLISASIAVINILPLPPFDGGLIMLMLVEKIRGAALSEKTQGVVAYAGWVLVLTLLLYVTFNDIMRTFFS